MVPTAPTSTGPVLVVGSGLLGASIGLGLRHLGVEVLIRDASPTTEAVAQDIGAGRSVRAAGGDVPEPVLVVVAAPPDVVAELVVQTLTDHPGATVLDIASVKAPVLDAVTAAGADLTRYVGTHPMAGREKSGPVAARGELFTTMPWVLCAAPETDPAAVKHVRSLAQDLGERLGCGAHLRLHGGSTSTELARALATNTGATSYHTRVLADAGLVVDTGLGDGLGADDQPLDAGQVNVVRFGDRGVARGDVESEVRDDRVDVHVVRLVRAACQLFDEALRLLDEVTRRH